MLPQAGQQDQGPPPPQQMEPARALGVWKSNFGAVKIEADNSKGGLQSGSLHGVWVYPRRGQEVIGYFAGNLRGNVLQLTWQEPSNPPLTGSGYLVFDPQGRQYSGRWWSETRDRVGPWNGWRDAAPQNTDPYAGHPNGGQAEPDPGAYGGQGYADPNPTYAPEPPPQPAPAPRPYY